jgi:Insect cuticle protein
VFRFRARGANIHRKQDLTQDRRDTRDDPSYAFGFNSKSHSRREESDSAGRVHGEFIYVDDVGEKHGVKYNAAAHSGFTVENGVPDAPSTINYNSPLYKTDPTARGKITFERGPDRQYKFLASSPDQRRAESTGPDGITRGSYSYLDDKGVQRTVQYIAGAGIGYKVISSTVGPGTHVTANSDVPEYSIKAVSNEISISDEPSVQYHHTGPSAISGPGYVSSTVPPYINSVTSTTTPFPPSTFSSNSYPPSTFSTPAFFPSTPRPFSRPNYESVFVTTPSSIGIHRQYPPAPVPTTPSYPSGGSGPSPLSPSGPSGSSVEHDLIYGLLPPKEEPLFTKNYIPPSPTLPTQIHITPSTVHHVTQHPTAPAPPSAAGVSTPIFYPTPAYLPTNPQSPYSYLPTQTPSVHYQVPYHTGPGEAHNNVNSGWFYGISAGATKRAHIQNIDLVAVHERAPSPSEALRRDEELESYNMHHQQHQHRV